MRLVLCSTDCDHVLCSLTGAFTGSTTEPSKVFSHQQKFQEENAEDEEAEEEEAEEDNEDMQNNHCVAV